MKKPEPAGIRCPSCGCPEHRIYYTRQKADYILRVRVCRHCGRKFSTYEQISHKGKSK